MVFDLIAQGGQDLVRIVAEVKAAGSVYEVGKQQIDRLRGFIGERQKENAAKLSEKTAAKLQNVSRDRLSPPSPSVVTPLLEAAVQESREQLQDLWAALLANAMIDDCRNVRRDFITTLSKLEPSDAVVLKSLNTPLPPDRPVATGARQKFHSELRVDAGLNEDEWQVSIVKLAELKLVREGPFEPALLPYGRAFLKACMVA